MVKCRIPEITSSFRLVVMLSVWPCRRLSLFLFKALVPGSADAFRISGLRFLRDFSLLVTGEYVSWSCSKRTGQTRARWLVCNATSSSCLLVVQFVFSEQCCARSEHLLVFKLWFHFCGSMMISDWVRVCYGTDTFKQRNILRGRSGGRDREYGDWAPVQAGQHCWHPGEETRPIRECIYCGAFQLQMLLRMLRELVAKAHPDRLGRAPRLQSRGVPRLQRPRTSPQKCPHTGTTIFLFFAYLSSLLRYCSVALLERGFSALTSFPILCEGERTAASEPEKASGPGEAARGKWILSGLEEMPSNNSSGLQQRRRGAQSTVGWALTHGRCKCNPKHAAAPGIVHPQVEKIRGKAESTRLFNSTPQPHHTMLFQSPPI